MSDIRGLFNFVPTHRGTPEVEALPESERPMILAFHCPGCRFVHQPIVGSRAGGGPRWTCNGDVNKPVMTPSLLVRWRRFAPDAVAETEAFKAQHGRLPTDTEVLPRWVEHVCHSFIGCNGAQPGQIVFLGDCTHALAGQTVDLPAFSWDER